MSGAICSGSSQRSQHTTLTSFAKQYPRLEEDYQTSITGRRHGRLCRPEPAPPVGDGAALAAPRQIPRNVAFGQGGQSHVTRRLSDHGVGANVCCGVCRLRWVPVARRLRVHPTRSRSRCTRPTRRARSAYRRLALQRGLALSQSPDPYTARAAELPGTGRPPRRHLDPLGSSRWSMVGLRLAMVVSALAFGELPISSMVGCRGRPRRA